MTDRRRPAPPRVRPPLVYGSAIAAFVIAGGGLSAQLASGNDPSLGAGAVPAPVNTVRRVETKVIVTTVVRHRAPKAVSTASSAPPRGAVAAAPSVQPSAAPQAPARATPPASPAPAPQPTTRSS
ncbi:MAG: hypothetical protein V9E83_09880 [Baekduia sp.]